MTKARYLVVRSNGEHRSIHDSEIEADKAAEFEIVRSARYAAEGYTKTREMFRVIKWTGRVW